MKLEGLRLERARASKHYKHGRFHNTRPVDASLKGNPLPIIGEFVFGGSGRKPTGVIPVMNPLPVWAQRPAGLRLTWLGHSTVLIELDGKRVLTDPVFGERVSPVSFAGAKRFHATPVTVEQLPPIDLVVLSHDHYDHLCRSTMQLLAKRRIPVVTPLGVGARLEGFGWDPALIHELDWWESIALQGLSVHATPGQHFSGRSLSDRNQTLWASWVIASEHHRVFFSGDTGLTEEFRSIAERLGPFDVTLLEIGAWHPSWGDIHLGPENALRAFELLGGGTLLPVHWATFDLGLHPWAEPAETLYTLAQAERRRLLMPMIGRPIEPAHVEASSPWWRLQDSAFERRAVDVVTSPGSRATNSEKPAGIDVDHIRGG